MIVDGTLPPEPAGHSGAKVDSRRGAGCRAWLRASGHSRIGLVVDALFRAAGFGCSHPVAVWRWRVARRVRGESLRQPVQRLPGRSLFSMSLWLVIAHSGGSTWVEVFWGPFATTALASICTVAVAVWLARRLELLGDAAASRRRRRLKRAVRVYRRVAKHQQHLPPKHYSESEFHAAPRSQRFVWRWRAWRTRRLNDRWKKHENKFLAEHQDARFETKMESYFSRDIEDAQEFKMMGEIAEEVLRRAVEQSTRRRARRLAVWRRWWRLRRQQSS